MDSIIYGIFAILYVLLLIWGIKGISTQPIFTWTNVIFLVVISLIYDNGILALGKWIGEGDLLERLNVARFWIHAFITPTLVLFSIGTLKESGVQWAQKSIVTILTIVYTISLIILEYFKNVQGLSLEAISEYGAIFYRTGEASSGLPLMIILITVVLFIASITLWIKTKWVIFFIGTFLMTVGSMVPVAVDSNAITNALELVLLFSLMWTKRKIQEQELQVKS